MAICSLTSAVPPRDAKGPQSTLRIQVLAAGAGSPAVAMSSHPSLPGAGALGSSAADRVAQSMEFLTTGTFSLATGQGPPALCTVGSQEDRGLWRGPSSGTHIRLGTLLNPARGALPS